MKKPKKILFLGLLLFVAILILPYTVNAATTIDSSSTPEYHESENLFEAKGTTITISASETEGNTTITWDGGSQEITSSNAGTLIVVGGYWNPATESETTISLESTTVNMTGGTIGYLVGGNLIGTNYSYYEKIYVGTINVNITGGTLKEVSAVSAAIGASVLANCNTALAASYYEKITEFYYADKVVMNIESATVSNRVYILSSYTYAEDVVVNVDDATIECGYYSLAVGTNGKVGTYVVNINDSTVDMIHAGFRAMVDSWTVNVTGNSTIGDIYAGSYYGVGERASDTSNWSNWSIGSVDYGQVGEMTFNLGENVTYNNIYAGFQFVDKELFTKTYGTMNDSGEYVLATTAAGIDGSENASVTINTYNAPSVISDSSDSSALMSMIDTSLTYVTLNYLTVEADVEETIEVGDATVTVDTDEIQSELESIVTNSDDVLEYVTKGYNVTSSTVEVTETESTEALETEVSNLGATVLNYIDISVYIVMTNSDNETQKITVTETSSELTFNVSVTNDVADGYIRTYYILREHDGSVDKLDCTLSDDETYVTFSTNKFSTYALAYVDEAILVTDITVSNSTSSSNSVVVGDEITLTATVTPTNAAVQSVTWSSSDSSVATVTSDGVVKGVKAGTATITATLVDGSEVTGTYEVTVVELVSEITVSNSTTSTIKVWDIIQLTATVTPTNATVQTVTWSSSDSSIATVTSDGVVEGIKVGTVTITATATDSSKVVGTYKVTVKTNYLDVASDSLWYYDAVKDMYQRGIMTGIGDGTYFAPNRNITRGMIVTILYRMEGCPDVDGSSVYSDVTDTSKYYYDAIVWATSKGIITGYGSTGLFKPDQGATREELALILYRYAKYEGIDVSTTGSLDGFEDASSVSSWAKTAVEWAVGKGIIQGVANSGKMYIKPASYTTRAQAATMISRYIANVK